jgi:SAM-dependent methyltransferase
MINNEPPESIPVSNVVRERYDELYRGLSESFSPERAAELAVGGEFFSTGALEYYLLKAHGLDPEKMVVDIGCGTGRLAYQLRQREHKRYAGFDIAAAAVSYARALCADPTWTFGVTQGLGIDVPDNAADFACFFSVFTHITHEHSYLYLKEAKRLLRPGGLVIFSFLEFRIPSHWTQFESAVRSFGTNSVPNVFLDRDGIGRFAAYLDLEVVELLDGDKPTIPLDEEIAYANGEKFVGRGMLGQSIGVLRKR